MRAAGVTPVIVFDGGRLPMKTGEEESRGRFVLQMATMQTSASSPKTEVRSGPYITLHDC